MRLGVATVEVQCGRCGKRLGDIVCLPRWSFNAATREVFPAIEWRPRRKSDGKKITRSRDKFELLDAGPVPVTCYEHRPHLDLLIDDTELGERIRLSNSVDHIPHLKAMPL